MKFCELGNFTDSNQNLPIINCLPTIKMVKVAANGQETDKRCSNDNWSKKWSMVIENAFDRTISAPLITLIKDLYI